MSVRAVYDTNVLLSALFSFTGPPFRCLVLARTGAVESVTCQAILDEFIEKLVEKFGFDVERAQQAAQEIREVSDIVDVPGQLHVVAADPDDDVVIECAVTGNAKYVVTGDRHLINLEQYADIQLVRPAWFVELVATAD